MTEILVKRAKGNSISIRVAKWLLRHYRSDANVTNSEDTFFGDDRSAMWYWRRIYQAIEQTPNWTIFSLIRVIAVGWLVVIFTLPFLIRFLVPGAKTIPLVFAAFFVAGLGTGAILALPSRPYHFVPVLCFVGTLFCRDLYRLAIFPGVQMSAPHHFSSKLHFETWLIWTSADIAFIVGVCLVGFLLLEPQKN